MSSSSSDDPAATRLKAVAAHLNYPAGLLRDQLCIITGAGQGIGAETARLFANEGARVVVSDIDAAKAAGVADGINERGGKALAIPGDLLKDGYIEGLVGRAAEFGGGKIHIIVNNAGFTWDGVIHKVGLRAFAPSAILGGYGRWDVKNTYLTDGPS
ncbi:MAG: hypothetical protein M1833_006431 [Piccolia ochrophora]|nr:MAG: hypothetical protein M1833_006431 [Piccolia ochrophora]